MPALPFQNLSLGVSPEVTNPWWEQFQLAGIPNGAANMGVATDCAVIFQLTSAQLLALQTTAVQLVAAPTTSGLPTYLVPPGGYLYIPQTMTLQYKFGGTAYTIGNADNRFQIEYTGQSVNLLSVLATGLVDQVVDKNATNDLGTGPILTTSTSKNLGLELKLAGTTPALTLGNGTVVLTMLYNIYALF